MREDVLTHASRMDTLAHHIWNRARHPIDADAGGRPACDVRHLAIDVLGLGAIAPSASDPRAAAPDPPAGDARIEVIGVRF